MDYNETLKYIHSVSNFFCKPGLERIKNICRLLGNPQEHLKFVHVAGTNGKGSFCSMLTSILIDAGYKVGTYTSPYILQFNERISINNQMISNDELTEICEYIKPFAEKLDDKLTEFEFITAVAFEYFSRHNCDMVVLECGMGGRYDATNIISTPVLSVITGIDFDHQNFLGDTIEKIAFEKAGIIKEKTPCLWCGNLQKAEKVIADTAKDMNAPLSIQNHGALEIIKSDLSGTTFNFKNYKNLFIHLLSLYQPHNASNAISAAEILCQSGFSISEENIRNGLKNASWPARFEIINNSPIVIFDGSHNPQGIAATIKSIKHYFGDKKVNVLTGVMRDKDYLFIAKEISKISNHVYCVTPDNPRALNADEYSRVFNNLGITNYSFNDIDEALKFATLDSSKTDTPLICMGSLYMYREIYNFFN